MDLQRFHELVMSLDGVRRTTAGGTTRWTYQGRLVAREVDRTHVVVRTPFDGREALVRRHPEAFSVPTRFAKHMKVLVDLEAAQDDAVEEAVVAAWDLQAGSEQQPRGQQRGVG